jgi:phenylalanyl-tRNA synthetase beta chain
MTISSNWLKDYIDLDLSSNDLADLLTSLGLEVEGMEEKESVKGGLEGVLVGFVQDCRKHPNADKLSLTLVDIGTDTPLQIVCGAPNVAAGQKVLVATVGTTLYPVDGTPINLKRGKIRGEVSEGMICAEDELGLGHDHSGILVLPPDTPVGMPAREYFRLEKDVIFEIGLTPNRSDATCHLGVARDLAAALAVQYQRPTTVRIPSVDHFRTPNRNLPVQVTVEDPAACPRYAGVSIQGVQVGESPDWLKNRLLSVGVRPINNIVDVTNFILHELGQPLHAFDLDKIAGRHVIVRTLPADTPFLTLDGKERSLHEQDLMICDGDNQGMCIAGVFGGAHSGVTGQTTDIFLESAHFNPGSIRRTSTRHDLRTDAARVFEKGSDPNLCVYALQRAALLITDIAGGTVASDVVDNYPQPIQPAKVTLSFAYVRNLIGADIPPARVKEILRALDMAVVEEDDATFSVLVPTNKPDVTRPADIVEEILRIFGLDNVPVSAQLRSSMVRGSYPGQEQLRQTAGGYLAANGFHEIMSLSLSQSAYYRDILPLPETELVFVNNTSNVQLDIMRPNMLFSGLEAIANNQNRQQPDLRLFEFGKTYHPNPGPGAKGTDRFREPAHLALFLCGRQWPESWRQPQRKEVDIFTLKTFAANILHRLGCAAYQESPLPEHPMLVNTLSLHRGAQILATLGQVKPAICKAMGIRSATFFADIDWDLLYATAGKQSVSLSEPNKFPSMRRDLALVIRKSVTFAEIAAVAKKTEKKLLKDINLFDVFEDESKLGAGNKSYAVSFLFEDSARTLQDEAVDKVMNALISAFEDKLQAVIRR